MQTNISIGRRVKELRKEQKMSQVQFAQKIGRDPSLISKIETGDVELSPLICLAICNRFGVRKEWLLTGQGTKHDDRMQLLEERARELGEDVYYRYITMKAAYNLREENKAAFEMRETDLRSYDVLSDPEFLEISTKVARAIIDKNKREFIKKLLDLLLSGKESLPGLQVLVNSVVEIMTSEEEGTKLALSQNIGEFREKIQEKQESARKIAKLEADIEAIKKHLNPGAPPTDVKEG